MESRGGKTRIGKDGILGCGDAIKLNEGLVSRLNLERRTSLDKIGDPHNTTIQKQSWLNNDDLNILDVWKEEWQNYIAKLEKGHIRLTKESDELIWTYNEEGVSFTSKIRYISITNWDPRINRNW